MISLWKARSTDWKGLPCNLAMEGSMDRLEGLHITAKKGKRCGAEFVVLQESRSGRNVQDAGRTGCRSVNSSWLYNTR